MAAASEAGGGDAAAAAAVGAARAGPPGGRAPDGSPGPAHHHTSTGGIIKGGRKWRGKQGKGNPPFQLTILSAQNSSAYLGTKRVVGHERAGLDALARARTRVVRRKPAQREGRRHRRGGSLKTSKTGVRDDLRLSLWTANLPALDGRAFVGVPVAHSHHRVREEFRRDAAHEGRRRRIRAARNPIELLRRSDAALA